MSNENQKQEQSASASASGQIQVKFSDEVLKGVYANNMQVGHSQEEFILDFMNLFPPAGVASARVIVSPQHFKRIAKIMQDSVGRYEAQYGKISESQAPEHKIGFRTE